MGSRDLHGDVEPEPEPPAPLAALVVAALLTIPVVVLAWRASTVVGALLLPYQGWVLIAASLSIGYARLNR